MRADPPDRLLVAFVRRHLVGLGGAALALLVVGPLLAPGFTLVYDMVFVPHPHVGGELLGLSPAYPRSVPTQAALVTATAVLGGEIVQKLALLGIFGLGVVGAARLVPARRPAARIAAGVLYAWNPFTYERLLLGQWALLLGAAIVPWALGAALRWRRGQPGSGWRLVLWMAALNAASPYTGIIGGVTVLAAALWPPADRSPEGDPPSGRPSRPRWRVAVGLGTALVVTTLPWLVPGLLHAGGPDRSRLAVELFRARSDSPVGTVGSLLSLGGLWRPDLAPPGRGTVAWIPAFAVIVAVAAWGWTRLRSTTPAGWRRGLAAAAAAGLVLAAAPSLPVLGGATRWIGAHVPGAGVLRDSQKFVLPWAALLAVAFGAGVDRVLDRVPALRRAAGAVAVVLAVLPVALAPTLAWGAWGRLHTARYPESWDRVERITSSDPSRGALMTLPWHAYLPFAWNAGQTVHQPAPLYFTRRVVAATSLEVGRRRLPGEDPWSRLLDGPATGPGGLAPVLPDLGIRYVLLFRGPGEEEAAGKVRGLRPVLRTADVTLYRSSPVSRVPAFDRPAAAPVIAGDVLAGGLVVAAAAGAWRHRARRRRRHTDAAGRTERTSDEVETDTGVGLGPPAMLPETDVPGGSES